MCRVCASKCRSRSRSRPQTPGRPPYSLSRKSSRLYVLLVQCAGFQCLDPHLRNPAFHRKYSPIWPAPQISGLPAQAKPQAGDKIAENAGQHVWHQWWVPVSRLLSYGKTLLQELFDTATKYLPKQTHLIFKFSNFCRSACRKSGLVYALFLDAVRLCK